MKTQHEKNIKKFGKPKFKDGDKVVTCVTGKDILTIEGDAWCNGFTWMYYFKGNEMGLGQEYITESKNPVGSLEN